MKKQLMIMGLLVGMLMVAVLPAVTTAKDGGKSACKNGGWMDLLRADNTPFANQGACVSYVAKGGTATSKTAFQIACENMDGTYVQGPTTYPASAEPLLEFAPSCEWQGALTYPEFLAKQPPLIPLCLVDRLYGFFIPPGGSNLGCV